VAAHRKALVLYFHPNQRTSRVGTVLANAAQGLDHVTFRDMYGLYPDFLIDVKMEQRLL
jgi:glutathione-regulated potassium-efflux system ancillary protein KefG